MTGFNTCQPCLAARRGGADGLQHEDTCVSLRDLAGGKTGSKRGDGGMPGSFDKEPAP